MNLHNPTLSYIALGDAERFSIQFFGMGSAPISMGIKAHADQSWSMDVTGELPGKSGLCLLRPIAVNICQDGEGYYAAENEHLKIFGTGEDVESALRDFLTSLEVAWKGLKDTKDYELTGNAVTLKDSLEYYFSTNTWRDIKSQGN